MRITNDEFISYEEVRSSGITNMWDVRYVCELSGLGKDKVMFIMKNYSKLKTEFAFSEDKFGSRKE